MSRSLIITLTEARSSLAGSGAATAVALNRTKNRVKIGPHFYQFYENYIQNKERLDIKKATEQLAIPHLLIHGDSDTSVLIDEAENLQLWNPNADYKIIKNADHVFNVKHPWKQKDMSKQMEEVVDLCINFIKK